MRALLASTALVATRATFVAWVDTSFSSSIFLSLADNGTWSAPVSNIAYDNQGEDLDGSLRCDASIGQCFSARNDQSAGTAWLYNTSVADGTSVAFYDATANAFYGGVELYRGAVLAVNTLNQVVSWDGTSTAPTVLLQLPISSDADILGSALCPSARMAFFHLTAPGPTGYDVMFQVNLRTNVVVLNITLSGWVDEGARVPSFVCDESSGIRLLAPMVHLGQAQIAQIQLNGTFTSIYGMPLPPGAGFSLQGSSVWEADTQIMRSIAITGGAQTTLLWQLDLGSVPPSSVFSPMPAGDGINDYNGVTGLARVA